MWIDSDQEKTPSGTEGPRRGKRKSGGLAMALASLLTIGTLPVVAAPHSVRPSFEPEIFGSRAARLPAIAAARVQAAKALAHRHLGTYRACSDLFEVFSADGRGLLERTRVLPADAESERRWCRKGAALLTHVGEPGDVWVCGDHAQRLHRTELAALLVHEALHHAGQTEWPSDPTAPPPDEITSRVRKACRL